MRVESQALVRPGRLAYWRRVWLCRIVTIARPQRPLIILVAVWLGLRTARILQRLHRVRRRRLPQLVLHFAEGVYRGLHSVVRGIQACFP